MAFELGPSSPSVRAMEHTTRLANARLGALKTIIFFGKMDGDGPFSGECYVQSNSVYGAAIALPQVARSCGWPGTLVAASVRIYLLCLANFLLQAYLISMIGEEQNFWYPFAGQMHLCDFGSAIQDCPDGKNCLGPGGTNYTYPRLYGYDLWSTRSFVKQSFQAVFPHTGLDQIDPGEYGLESFWCRLACVSLFLLATMDDLSDNLQSAKTLLMTPAEPEPWVEMDVPDWASKQDVKEFNDHTELDLVNFKVAGMPLHWKLLNAIIILLPKTLLWIGVVRSGVHYLMETGDIIDVVVNGMALSFILSVDEMIFSRLCSSVEIHIMRKMEPLKLYDTHIEEHESDEQAIARFEAEAEQVGCFSFICGVVPFQFIALVLLQAGFLWDYYNDNCDRLEDGSSVSKAMHLPAQLHVSWLNYMFGLQIPLQLESFWTRPSA